MANYEKVRIGIIGVGRIGALHAENIVKHVPDAELVAVADVIKELAKGLSKRLSIPKVYGSYEEIVEDDDVDALMLAIPNNLHCQVINKAIDKGKHVLCEKPMGISSRDAEEVARRSEVKGIKVQVGYNRRFDPSYVKAKRLIEEGKIGRIVIARSNTRDPEPPKGWEARPEVSGGIFFTSSSHDFDTLRWLVGKEVKEVYAIGETLFYKDMERIGDYDNVMVAMRFVDGTLGYVDVSRTCSYGHDVKVELLGTEGAVRIEKETESYVKVYAKEGVSHDYPYWFKQRFSESYILEVKDFIECILKDRKPRVSARDAAAVLKISEAAKESAREGKPVRVM